MSVDAMPGTAVRTTRQPTINPLPVLLLGLLLITLAMQAYYWSAYGRRWTDSDQTILWLMARDLSHGHLHQLNFYGQTYATGWETLPAAVLLRLGESPTSAVPLATTVLATLVFVLLAIAAVRDQRWWLAAGFLAIVPFASPKYLILLDAPRGVLGGLFLGTLAVTIWFCWRESAKATACLFALGPLAVQFDMGTVLVVGPVFVVAAVRAWRRRWWATYGFLAVPILYAIAAHVYDDQHPGQDRFHPSPFMPRPHVLVTGLKYLPDYFRLFNLGPVPGVWVVLGTLSALAYMTFRRRSADGGLALAALVLLLIVMLSSPKSQDAVGGTYLSPSRLFLALPMACGVVALCIPIAERFPVRAARPGSILIGAGAGVVLLAAAAFVHLIWSMPGVTRKVTAANTTNFILQVARSRDLVTDCAADATRAQQHGAQVVAYNNASKHAYGCAALHSQLATLDLPYERRSWRIDGLKDLPHRVLLVGAPGACSHRATSSPIDCEPVGGGEILLTSPGATLSQMLRSVGLAVLPLDPATLPPNCMRLRNC